MSRRRFCWTLAGVLVAPGIAIAQASKVRRIGILSVGTPATQADTELEVASLRALGWVEGQNLLIERRNDSSPRAIVDVQIIAVRWWF